MVRCIALSPSAHRLDPPRRRDRHRRDRPGPGWSDLTAEVFDRTPVRTANDVDANAFTRSDVPIVVLPDGRAVERSGGSS